MMETICVIPVAAVSHVPHAISTRTPQAVVLGLATF
jgi:hypothetical protein